MGIEVKERFKNMPYMKSGKEPPKKGKGSKLSPKMEAFIDEFMISRNASDAILKAGYKTTNQNKIGAELLNHPLVRAEIDRRTEERREKSELHADYLINKLVNVIDNMEEKTSDRLKAIELAGKTLALWRERQEITGADGDAIKMEQELERNVSDFKSKLTRLSKRTGTGGVTEFPKPERDSGA